MILKTFYVLTLVRCCVFITFIASVTGQLCTTQKMVRTTYQVPQKYSYLMTYSTKCWYGSCRKTKYRVRTQMRTFSKVDLQPVEECCDGYYNDTENSPLICKPICTPECQNGYCKSPGECECNDGYENDSLNSYSCFPICFDCDFGTCVSPENCQCKVGYYYSNSTCLPYCSRDCDYGTCVSPDNCKCNEGYTMIDERCRPICDQECINGTCTAPGVCSCDEDYELVNNTCMPVCEFPCGNGICVEPDICECFEGYSSSNNCDPECCKPKCGDCGRGDCYEPGVCRCETGFMNENGKCVPECKFNCGHGICISPDKCECDPGYNDTRYGIDNQTVCEPVCQNCEGICISPDICICEYPLEAKNVTSKGEDCDCVYDCPRICDKIICVPQKYQQVTDFSIQQPDTTSNMATLGIIATEEVTETDLNKIKVNVIPIKEHTTLKSVTKQDDKIYSKFRHLSNKTQKQQDEGVFSVWVIGIITMFLLVLLILIIFIIVKRDFISKYFRRNDGSYNVEDYDSSL